LNISFRLDLNISFRLELYGALVFGKSRVKITPPFEKGHHESACRSVIFSISSLLFICLLREPAGKSITPVSVMPAPGFYWPDSSRYLFYFCSHLSCC